MNTEQKLREALDSLVKAEERAADLPLFATDHARQSAKFQLYDALKHARAALAAQPAAVVAEPAGKGADRCQACIDRNDGFYGSYAPPCSVHYDDGTLRPTLAAAPTAPGMAAEPAAPSQAHGKSEPVAYPKLPRNGDEFPGYAQFHGGDMHAYVDADRAQRPAAPADGAALAEDQGKAALILLREIRYHPRRHDLERSWLTKADDVLGTFRAPDCAAVLASAQGDTAQPVPMFYASPKQAEAHEDPETGEGGKYLPLRKTPLGKFTMPLYATPQPAPVAEHATTDGPAPGVEDDMGDLHVSLGDEFSPGPIRVDGYGTPTQIRNAAAWGEHAIAASGTSQEGGAK